MDAPTATIITVEGHSALVRVEGAIACARCAAGNGCGAGMLTGDPAPRELRVPLPPNMHFASGDQVQLTLQPARLLVATLYAYGLPLVALTLLPLLANWLWGPLTDATLAAVALAAIVAAVLLSRRLLARGRCLEQLTPAIAGRTTAGER